MVLKNLDLRRRANAELNKGEARNTLARTIFFYRLIATDPRDRNFESQVYRASGLNLLIAAIICHPVERAICKRRLLNSSRPFHLRSSLTRRRLARSISVSRRLCLDRRRAVVLQPLRQPESIGAARVIRFVHADNLTRRVFTQVQQLLLSI